MPPQLILLAVEVGACLGHLPRLLSSTSMASTHTPLAPAVALKEDHMEDASGPRPVVVLIMGCGRVGLMAMCLVRHMAPSATILATDMSQDRLHLATGLSKANKVQRMYVL